MSRVRSLSSVAQWLRSSGPERDSIISSGSDGPRAREPERAEGRKKSSKSSSITDSQGTRVAKKGSKVVVLPTVKAPEEEEEEEEVVVEIVVVVVVVLVGA